MATYRQLLKEIEAIQFDGYNYEEILRWVNEHMSGDRLMGSTYANTSLLLSFHEYELGLHQSDYIIKFQNSNVLGKLNYQEFMEQYEYVSE